MKNFLQSVVLLLVVLAALWLFYQHEPSKEQLSEPEAAASSSQIENQILETSEYRSRLMVGDVCIDLGVANTPKLRARGLSGEPEITEHQGLLFTYEQSGDYGFWMRDMNFPIDIIWLDGEFRVINFKKRAHPSSYPDTTFYPEAPARYVVELAAGRVSDLGISPGDVLAISESADNASSCVEVR